MTPHATNVWYVATVSALVAGVVIFAVVETYDRIRARAAGRTQDSSARKQGKRTDVEAVSSAAPSNAGDTARGGAA